MMLSSLRGIRLKDVPPGFQWGLPIGATIFVLAVGFLFYLDNRTVPARLLTPVDRFTVENGRPVSWQGEVQLGRASFPASMTGDLDRHVLTITSSAESHDTAEITMKRNGEIEIVTTVVDGLTTPEWRAAVKEINRTDWNNVMRDLVIAKQRIWLETSHLRSCTQAGAEVVCSSPDGQAHYRYPFVQYHLP